MINKVYFFLVDQAFDTFVNRLFLGPKIERKFVLGTKNGSLTSGASGPFKIDRLVINVPNLVGKIPAFMFFIY